MINVLLNTIPKGINEYFFYISIVSALLSLTIKRDKRVLVLLSIALFMIIWRVFIRITSSRYSIAIIYPSILLYSIALAQFCLSIKILFAKRIVFLAFLFLLIIFAIKDTSISITNHRIKDVVDFMHFISTKKKVSFFIQSKEEKRLSFYTDKTIPINEITETEYYFYYIREYHSNSDFDCIHRISSHKDNFQVTQDSSKKIYSFSQGGKNKNYFTLTKRNKPYLDVFYSFVETNNMLDNGDFEEIETRENHINRSKQYLHQYPNSHETLFAKGSFFHFGKSSPLSESDYFGIISSDTISGSHSAKISTLGYPGYLFFYEHLDPGVYILAFLTKASPQTDISTLVNINGSVQYFPANFTINDYGLHQATVGFFVQKCDFFMLGFSVNGTVTIDNVVLRKIDTL